VAEEMLPLTNFNHKATHNPLSNTGRFIMFSVITNIYNKKPKDLP
jgi:hypothetical protein